MKGIHWSIWVVLFILVLLIAYLSTRKEGYAPPRDQNTMPPYTEQTSNQYMTSNNSPYVELTGNTVPADDQTQIYKDMGGLDSQIQAGNPILNFIQGDPSSNVIYGDFMPHESDGGSAKMYTIQEQTSNAYSSEQYLPEITSPTIPFIGALPPVPSNPPLMSPDMSGATPPLTPASISGMGMHAAPSSSTQVPTSNNSILTMTTPAPVESSASVSPVSTTSPIAVQ
jgi:hypothetical protein